MEYREELENLGVNVAEGVDRVMGDEPLYEMMLGMFSDTIKEARILFGDFEQADIEELTAQVHSLKGMTGNLSLTPLYDGYVEMLGLLREGKVREAGQVMERMMPVQEKITSCIERNRS